MRFIANQSLLNEVLGAAMNAVPSKSTLQILGNFLLRLEGNFLEVGATDLDIGIRLRIEVQGLSDGEIVVNARKFYDVVRAQSQTQLEIVVDNYLVRILSGSNRTNITGNDSSEFPELEEVAGADVFTINSSELSFLAEKTLFAASTDATRLSLNGVYCHREEGHLVLVATDGHRLGKATLECEGAVSEKGAIIPPKVLNQLLKVVNPDSPVEVFIGERHIAFAAENVRLVSKLLEGPYPRYQNVIPVSFDKYATIQREEVLNVVQRIGVVAHPRTHQIRFALSRGQLEVSATNQDIGADASETVGVQYEGDDSFKISFNAIYLQEILRKCLSDRVKLKMNGPLGAVLLEPEGPETDHFFLIMPLRLHDEP